MKLKNFTPKKNVINSKKGEVIGLSDLNSVTLSFLLAGIFFAVGIVILAAMQTNSYTSTVVTLENLTLPTAINGSATFANAHVTSIQSIQNATGFVLGSGNYTLNTSNVAGNTVVFTQNSTIVGLCNVGAGQWCLVNYTFGSNTTAAPLSVAKTITAMSELPSNWFGLIAVVIAAAIIIGIVIQNMGFAGGRS